MLTASELITAAAVAGGAGTGALIDLRIRRVPNPLTLAVASLGIVLAATGASSIDVTSSLIGFALGFLLMLPGHLIGATGAGDVKLLAALGAVVGPRQIVWAFLYTAIVGGIFALLVAMRRRRLRRTLSGTLWLVAGAANRDEIQDQAADNRFPYAPAIAVGAMLAALGF